MGNYVIRVGNYVTASRSQLGNFVIVDMLIARFSGDVAELTRAYDRGHAMIMAADGAGQFGELRHHCATSQDALYIVGVWRSEEHLRTRWQSPELEGRLVSVGFPSPRTADITILDLHAIEPPL